MKHRTKNDTSLLGKGHKLCEGGGGIFLKNSIFKMMTPPFLDQKRPKKGHFGKNPEFSMMTPPIYSTPSHSKWHFPYSLLLQQKIKIIIILVAPFYSLHTSGSFLVYSHFLSHFTRPPEVRVSATWSASSGHLKWTLSIVWPLLALFYRSN